MNMTEQPMPTVQAGRAVHLLRRPNVRTGSPCPTVMAGGLGGGNTSQYRIELDHLGAGKGRVSKPSYRVPSMAEIAEIPWNGFKVVSTFSGCGGSCLGYCMAGFRVLWANEFIPAAQDTYRVNFPDSILDERDIRLVLPEEILEAIGMKPGNLDLLDGSPPCQAFSTAGKREKGWGQARTYENGARQCNETLFGEYVRILKGLMPRVFVAENVSGLVKGVAKGYFLEILAALKAAGYRVRAQVLDAQWLGVPQMRGRVIFIGVREDLGLEPAFPKPLPYRYSVREALPWIVKIGANKRFAIMNYLDQANHPSGAIPTNSHHAAGRGIVEAELDIARFGEARVIHDTSGLFSQGDVTDRPCPAITVGVKSLNSNHFQVEVETDISRYAIGREWDKLKPGEQSDRYFQMVKAPLDGPCNAVTAAGGGAGGKAGHIASIAAVCHPTEKRKFSIAELRRICAFPDDFILTGTYAQQWERLGNAVPPVMMRHIAEAIRDEVLIRGLRGLS